MTDLPDLVDRAIDRAARDLTTGGLPPDLTSRILERLETADGSGWWTPWRLAWTSGALAALVIAGVTLSLRDAQPPVDSIELRMSAGPPSMRQPDRSQADVESGAAPGSVPSVRERRVGAETRPEDVDPRGYEFRAVRLVAALAPPDPLAIEPLEDDRVTIPGLVFESIQIEPIRVAPLFAPF